MIGAGPGGCQRRRARLIALIGGCLLGLLALAASADKLDDSAARLSDEAFSLLNSLHGAGSGSDEVLGAIAGFAGDAQALTASIASRDGRGASKAMAALIADRSAIERILAKNPKALDAAQWNSLKSQLASLEKQVPAAKELRSGRRAGAHAHEVVPPPPEETSALGPAPKIVVVNRVTDDQGMRIKGYFEGQDLKSAGIYDGETLLTPVEIGSVRGRERVNFDLGLDNVTAREVLRVTDSVGRTAEIRVAPESVAGVEPRSKSHEKMIELGASPLGSAASGPPAVVASKGTNTVEIPTRSPSRRYSHSEGNKNLSPLAGVQINILGVMRSMSGANSYQVVGQISGEGVRRAGIYVDGRLVKSIPVTPGQYTSFDVAFQMLGKAASIRVYGNGKNFVESGIDLSSASGEVFSTNPSIGPNPFGYGVNPYGNPYAPAYPYGYGSGYPVNPYGSMNPYAPAPYGYGPPLRGYGAPVRPAWPFP